MAFGRACQLGIVQRLRLALGDETGSHVGLSPTLRPPPVMGQFYVSVGMNTYAVNGKSNANGVDEIHTVSVCVTTKYGFAPQDRQAALSQHSFDFATLMNGIASEGRSLLVEQPQIQPPIDELAEYVHDLLIQDYTVLTLMNGFLGPDPNANDVSPGEYTEDSEWGFFEPFHTGAKGNIDFASSEWVAPGSAASSAQGDIQTLICTVAGARAIRPQRYVRGLDR